MGSMKDFDIFRRDNLHLSDKAALAAWAGEGPAGALAIEGDRDLSWEDIETVTGERIGRFNVACPYCGPDKPSSTRFQIDRYSYGQAKYHCFYCGRSGKVKASGPIDPVKEAEAKKAAKVLREENEAERTANALKWWEEATSIGTNPIVERYFAARAIFEMPPNVDEVLRWHPAAPFLEYGMCPLLLALLRDAKTNEPRAIQRTYIVSPDRGLARRAALGPIARSVIKLWPLNGVEVLFLAEGLETAMSIAAMTFGGEPARPVWAATVANNVASFPLLPGVKRLIVMADNDPSRVGELKAQSAIWRYRRAGRDGEMRLPKEGDWNDVAKEFYNGSR
jgi:hypothetical protein